MAGESPLSRRAHRAPHGPQFATVLLAIALFPCGFVAPADAQGEARPAVPDSAAAAGDTLSRPPARPPAPDAAQAQPASGTVAAGRPVTSAALEELGFENVSVD